MSSSFGSRQGRLAGESGAESELRHKMKTKIIQRHEMKIQEPEGHKVATDTAQGKRKREDAVTSSQRKSGEEHESLRILTSFFLMQTTCASFSLTNL